VCGIVAALPAYQSVAGDGQPLPALPGPPLAAAALLRQPAQAERALRDLLDEVEAVLHALGTETTNIELLRDGGARQAMATACAGLMEWAAELDRLLDTSSTLGWDADSVELVQGVLGQLTDRLYTVLHDRITVAESARALCPGEPTHRCALTYLAIETVLQAVNRLEVRGRDSAGLSIWVRAAEADTAALADLAVRRADPLLRSGSVVVSADGVCFVYKHAAIVGKLGDNVTALRQALRDDTDLHSLLALPSATVTVLAHTRWASVGRISEANAHPVDNRIAGPGDGGPFSIAVLNGDIDNYGALARQVSYEPDEREITTDAKIIPVLLSQQLAPGAGPDGAGPYGTDPGGALCTCLGDFAGSMAIAAQAETRDEVLLAVKGSGQSVYVGLGYGGFVVASEVYGLVATTSRYLRVDGAAWPGATRQGTVLALPRRGSGTLAAIRRWDGDGVPRPVDLSEVRMAEVTTRDLALDSAVHYLHKEIHEAPSSFRKTLRGRLRELPAGPAVRLPPSSLPPDVRSRIADGQVREIVVIGQGTAAVAAQGVAQFIRDAVGDRLAVTAMPASEFSASCLYPDMTDMCVVAISQSGTTTDTNRSVDLARDRGAAILSIVNRRDSDLTTKSHGVLYTSDGRDVEMSVASTKAFYAQVAAGCLLGIELGRELGLLAPEREASLIGGLQRIPGQLLALQASEELIAKIATEAAARYPYWAVVGSGPNRVAAAEIRIKLSELCYKTISTDAVEDKKHIDLSAEALVLVCVAGAPPGQVSDLIKEVEILAAHGNTPVVLCDEGTEQTWPTDLVVGLPLGHPEMMWIVATAAGHLFAYHAARRIDAAADPLRVALSRLETAVDNGLGLSAPLPREVLVPVIDVLEDAGRGQLSGVLTSGTALGLARLALQPARPGLGPETFSSPAGQPVDLARAVLAHAIDELGRPIDSVKHQAKTVTVGTSRDDADVYDNDVVAAMRDAGVDLHSLTLPVLRVVRAQARVIKRVTGVTYYRVGGAEEPDTIRVVRKTGSAAGLASRADHGSPLMGSKRRVAELRTARLLRGRSDGRVVLVVPEQDYSRISHLCVVHVELHERCEPNDLVAAMDAVGDRMAEIVAAVTETVPSFEPARLREFPVEDVLLAPVEWLAERLAAG
jgi:glutamine---fructose-6-phosphate transaminase (isomerizing)